MPSSRSQPSKDDPMFFFFMCLLLFAFEGHADFVLWSLLRLLDEAVKQHHVLPLHAEKHPRNSAPRQVPPDLPQFLPKRANQRHADGPRELYVLNILPDRLPVLRVKPFQPIPYGLAAGVRAVKARRQALEARIQRRLYQSWYAQALLPDAERREDPIQNVVRGGGSG